MLLSLGHCSSLSFIPALYDPCTLREIRKTQPIMPCELRIQQFISCAKATSPPYHLHQRPRFQSATGRCLRSWE